jgi:nanoRNase/pAp phosphatase (c-di-AMP/oligoRNAs hydrolase)
MVKELSQLIERVKGLPRVVIQAHDFPDHDAVASAYALAYLLNQQGIATKLVYNGVIDRVSIHRMIEILAIPIVHASEADLRAEDILIVVDGCVGEKNVTDLTGEEVAVIDHHQVTPAAGLWYEDIRPDYGATATIIYEYYLQLGVAMPGAVATALQVGLNIDTANLTRGVCEADVAAFAFFHRIADQDLVNNICRNSLESSELPYYQHLLSELRIERGVAIALMPSDCPKNLLGLLGDFLIAVDNVDVSILACGRPGTIQLSLRSERPEVNVAQLARQVLVDTEIGFGGGHTHMAGGMVNLAGLQHTGDAAEHVFSLFLQNIPD